jgi:hypothetical protein
MRLIALLTTFNEERFIAACLQHLIQQGAEVCLIDNESTDRTVTIAREFLGRGLIDIQTMPRAGVFDLTAILAHKEWLAATLEADWFLNVDADEFHMSPRAGQSLVDAFAEVGALGDNVINFIEFAFVPTQEAPDHDHPDFQRTMHWYYLHQPDYPFLMRAWKKQPTPVGLVPSGGHKLQFPGLRLHPQPFFVRHYLCLSASYAARKYVGRKFRPEELRAGWHGWRARVGAESIQLPKQSDLSRYNDDGRFDISRPRAEDFLANTAEWLAGSNRTVVCVAGMHRSGTSMVARLLNRCGLDLGPEQDLVAPDQYNQDGYWENRSFVEVNEAILSQLGSGWDAPPPLVEGWDLQLALMPLRVRAAGLVQRFARHAQWGWKDPRTSLTWAFWKRLIPDLKLVICVRNPLEVAQSLSLHGNSSTAFGLNLWLAYNQRLLSAVRPEDRIVTHYASFFDDPEAELRRLISLLHLSPSAADIENALADIALSHQHDSADTTALLCADLSDEALLTYSALCAEAGPVYHRSLAAVPKTAVPPPESGQTSVQRDFAVALQLSRLEAKLDETAEQLSQQAQVAQSLKAELAEKTQVAQSLKAELAEKTQVAQSLKTELAEKTQVAQSLRAELAENTQVAQSLKAELAEKTQVAQSLKAELAENTEFIQGLQTQLRDQAGASQLLTQELDESTHMRQAQANELDAIHQSKFWKATTLYWRARYVILHPRASLRQWLGNSIPH